MGTPYDCVYCGKPRQCLDHIPPLSALDALSVPEIRNKGIDLIKVPCCNKCNSYLGNRRLFTIKDRILFLYDKYSILLNKKPHWSKEEINELSGNLKNMVVANQNKVTSELLERLEHIQRHILNF